MISEEYKNILSTIHANTKFGKRRKLPDHLADYIESKNPQSILDFGCGKGMLVDTLKEKYSNKTIYGFDPANPSFNKPIQEVDMIVSTDVLEHIEPIHIDATLKEIYDNCKTTYHLISCAPAKLILSDGRNAHLIQETPVWWKAKFESMGFKVTFEEYRDFKKYSKQLKKDLPVKNYFITAEK
jgi:SAM-dependent methyltransferase